MRQVIALSLLIPGWLLAQPGPAMAAAADGSPAASSRWVTLFDGKTLTGWSVEPASQAKQFSVANGVIQVLGSPQGGWLHTTRKYSDFTLKYDVRYVSPDHKGNSGLLLRSPEISLSGRNWPGRGFEVESRDMNDPASILPWEGSILGLQPDAPLGRFTLDTEAAKRAYRPTGEWNSVEVIAHGNRIWTRLNGEWLATAFNAAHADGHLGFQSEDGAAEFRNVRILEHDAGTVTPDTYVKLFDAGTLQGLVVDDARFASNVSIRDGVLHLEGSGGWLRTSSLYTNYSLRLEFRILAANTDSGVYLRALPGQNDATGWPLVTTEAELRHLPGKLPTEGAADRRWIGAILYRGGANGSSTIDTSAVVSAYRPLGEWQEVLIQVQGRQVRYWLNGQLISEGDNVANAPGGYVGLQIGPGGLDFRRIEIKGYALD